MEMHVMYRRSARLRSKHHPVDICDKCSNRVNIFGVISSVLAVNFILIPPVRTWGVQVLRSPNFFLGEWKQIET